METKQNVRAEIIALEIGEFADFPISRYEYVLSCRTKLAKVLGRIFTSTTYIDNLKGERVAIARTA